MTGKTFACDECGGTFDSEWTDEEADAQSLERFGATGSAPGMAQVCSDCYKAIGFDPDTSAPPAREPCAIDKALAAKLVGADAQAIARQLDLVRKAGRVETCLLLVNCYPHLKDTIESIWSPEFLP